jgi:adenosylcobyric acid synthase
MLMGTASDVGKSVVVTALCRAFLRAGVRVAPFKAQNMSNNAAVCAGGEIGRAQAVQAEACRLEPTVDMNPVLLKPEGETGCQVVIGGRARFRMQAHEHDHYRAQAWPEIERSYRRLAANYDLIVIEGAGGAAEINLRHRDLVNWATAEMTGAPVLIVGDIDKGGVFASLFGTVELLAPADRARVRGFIINKFRGDERLLHDGLRTLEARTGLPVLGVLPYLRDLRIPQEDSAMLETDTVPRGITGAISAGVVRLPRISNYTDFAPLEAEPDVAMHYLSDAAYAPELDVLFLPGTKNTAADLDWMRRAGWENYIVRHRRRGGRIVGICGGYQMLGRRIIDSAGIESAVPETIGLGLLEIETRFEAEKITARVSARHLASGLPVSGYEIHAGRLVRVGAAPALLRITRREESAVDEPEGAQSEDGRVIGTSVHGLFDSAGFRRHFLDAVRIGKGLGPLDAGAGEDFRAIRERAYDRIAEVVTAHLDLSRIAALAGIT